MNWLKRCAQCGLPKTALAHVYQHSYVSRRREVVSGILYVALVITFVALAVLMVTP